MREATASPRVQWFTNIISGLVVSFSEIVSYVSLASLLFAGVLAAFLPYGVTIVLVTTALNVLVMWALTRQPNLFSVTRSNTTVLLGLAIANATHNLPREQAFPTALAIIFVATLGLGILFWVLGRFHLGDLVRYVPYPVIGGFMAGTGWLLLRGAIVSTSGTPFTTEALFATDALVRWLPAVGFGVLLFFATRLTRHSLVVPALFVLGAVGFYAVLAAASMSLEDASRAQLMVQVVDSRTTWQPLPIAFWAQADWGAVLREGGTILTIMLVGVLTLLLNISSIEVLFKADFDVNHEMRSAGIASVIVGLAGGVIGFRAIGTTSLGVRLGAKGHLPPLMLAGLCIAMIFIGLDILTFVPKMLLGGVLFFLGLDYLNDWVFKGYKTLEASDYAVVLVILLTIALTDFLVGVGVGVVLMVLSFVVNYSRVNIFQYELSGASIGSNVMRHANQRDFLKQHTAQIYLLKLQGYLFFGTANSILMRVRHRMTESPTLKFLVLDFQRVTNLDSSAVFSLNKVAFLAEIHDFKVVFTSLTPQIEETLAHNGLHFGGRLVMEQDIDYALEYCENAILGSDLATTMNLMVTFNRLLSEGGFTPEQREIFEQYLDKQLFQAGDYLTRQGEVANDLFFVVVGQISIYLATASGKRLRLQTLTMGSVVGELAFQLRMTRSASVVADTNTQVYRLSRERFEQLEHDHPAISALMKNILLNAMAQRLTENNQRLAAFTR